MPRTLPLPADGYEAIPDFPELIRHPDVLAGRPCIRGTRISVDLILGFLAAGSSVDEIEAAYEDLAKEEIVAVLRYAAASIPGAPPRESVAA